ncbi:MAG: SRPBCC family protein [Gammaproteobacteria bacterium]
MEVFASTTIARPATDVWAVARDFVGLTAWSNVVAAAEIDNGRAADQVGAVRRLTLSGGDVFVETLVSLCDRTLSLSYDIVDGPLPVSDYLATIAVTPVTADDTSFVSWGAVFDTPPEHREAMREVVGAQICAGGLAALKAYLEAG